MLTALRRVMEVECNQQWGTDALRINSGSQTLNDAYCDVNDASNIRPNTAAVTRLHQLIAFFAQMRLTEMRYHHTAAAIQRWH